jgi:hypothetical protein
MPRKPNFTLDVKIVNQEAFTHDLVIRQPRIFKPQDVLIASSNISITANSGNLPQAIFNLAKYIISDYFYFAHRTGLYNRQRMLWESLAKISSIEIFQVEEGLFKKKAVPIFDLLFCDYKKKALIMATLVEKDIEAINGQNLLSCIMNFLIRVRNQGKVNGLFAAFPHPFPSDVYNYVLKATNGADPVAHFEAFLPNIGAPLNLLSMTDQLYVGESEPVSLVYPDLSKRKLL